MATSPQGFDPYHRWLGIPSEEQPPNYYRLLGVTLFEQHPEVISSAADRQMAHVRSFQTGQHSDSSQRILNELAMARVCLLNPSKKAEYDERLRMELMASASAGATLHARHTGKQAVPTPLLLIGGAAAVLAMLLVVLVTSRPKDVDSTASVASAEKSAPAHTSGLADNSPTDKRREQRARADAYSAVVERPEAPPESKEPPAEPPEPAPEQAPEAAQGHLHGSADLGRSESAPEAIVEPEQATEPQVETPQQQPEVSPIAEIMTSGAEPAEVQSPLSESDQTDERLPIPDEASLAKSLQLIRDLYKPEFDRSATREQQADSARKLLEQASATAQDPVGRYALFSAAVQIAVDADDLAVACRAVDEMSRHYRLDAREMKSAILAKISGLPRTKIENQNLAGNLLAAIDEAIAARDYEMAKQLAALALDGARKARDGRLVRQVTARSEEIEKAVQTQRDYERVLAALQRDPADADANLAAGVHQCFHQEDWEAGLPLLARGSDSVLKSLAQRELQGVASPTDMVDVADRWHAAGQRNQKLPAAAISKRAEYWYRRALPQLSGMTKVRVEKRLEEIGRASGFDDQDILSLHLAAEIDGSDTVDFYPTHATWTHHRWGWPSKVRIEGFSWSPSNLPTLPFTGELGNALRKADFSSAELKKIKGRGAVTLQKAPDHFSVNFNDGGGGTDFYEVLITIRRLSQ